MAPSLNYSVWAVHRAPCSRLVVVLTSQLPSTRCSVLTPHPNICTCCRCPLAVTAYRSTLTPACSLRFAPSLPPSATRQQPLHLVAGSLLPLLPVLDDAVRHSSKK